MTPGDWKPQEVVQRILDCFPQMTLFQESFTQIDISLDIFVATNQQQVFRNSQALIDLHKHEL